MQYKQLTDLVNSVRIERVLDHINQLAQVGKTERGGITRLAFSEEDRQARGLVIEWMREAGLSVRISPIGNIIGKMHGDRSDMPVIMTGSHIDTVVTAGKFDGTLGVIAAIEIAQIIKDNNISLPCSIEVVCFVMEESSRFKIGYAFGSKVWAGQLITDELLLTRDRDGKTLVDAIYEMRTRELGSKENLQSQDDIMEAVKDYIVSSHHSSKDVRAFVELHIEQGPILYSAKEPIGVVTAIAAPTRFTVTFLGEQNHSGTTPMRFRKDALAASAEAILAIERLCRSSNDVVGTVGVIEVNPNTINIIPGRTQITIDIRSASSTAKSEMFTSICQEIKQIADNREVTFEIHMLTDDTPQPISEEIISLIERNCLKLGIRSRRLVSGAGHDAAQVARIVGNTGMIFVPSRDGISHDPREWTDGPDIERGTQVLLLTLLDLAQTAE